MCIWWLVYVFIAAMCFSKFCICTVNVVLSLSTLSSGMATSRHETFWGDACWGTDGCNAACCLFFCFFCGMCARCVKRKRTQRWWEAADFCHVLFCCEKMSFEGPVEGFSAEMFANDRLDVHLTDDSSSDCWLAVKTAEKKTEQSAWSFLVLFRGVRPQSPLKKKKKKCVCVYWLFLETIVPYFVLSIFKAFFFLTDGSRFLIGHLSVCFNGTDS